MADRQECEALKRALEEAHTRLTVPKVGATLTSGAAPRELDVGNQETETDAQVWEEIRNIERAMRDAGCD